MRAHRFAASAWLCALLSFLLVGGAQAQSETGADPGSSASSSPPAVVVLQGATIHTMTDQGTIVGSVVIENGKITAVGEDVKTPEGATVIDLTGHTLTPGLIDSHSVLWLTAAARGEAGSRGALNILDGVNPWIEDWREVSRQGVTSVYVQPSNQGPFGGRGAVLRVGPGSSTADLVVQDNVAVQAAMGITGDSVRERASQIERFKRAFQAVKDGEEPPSLAGNNNNAQQQAPQGFGRGRRGGVGGVEAAEALLQQGRRGRGGRGGGRGGAAASQPDKTKELIEMVLDRKIPLRMEVHQADVVQAALDLAEEFDFELVLEGLSAPESALTDVARLQSRVVVGPVWETSAVPAYRNGRSDDWLTTIADATNRWSLATFATDARGSRMLRVQAAAAVAAGVDPETVLRAVTVEAARNLGVSDTIGTIAPGMQADLAVFAGDPLDPAAAARLVMTRGEVVYENEATAQDSSLATVELPEQLPSAFVVRTKRMLDANGQMRPGEMFVQNGRVAAIGEKIEIPDGVEVFDIGEAVVSPGLVVAHSYLGQQADLSDNTEADASHLRAVDIVNATSPVAKEMLAGGFVNVAFAPASVNPAAGVVGHVRLGAKQPVVADNIAGKFVLSSAARSDERLPSSLVGQIMFLDSLFSGKTPETRLYVPPAVARAIERERRTNVDAVVTGGRPAIIAAQTGPEIEAALRLTRSHGLNTVLLEPAQANDLIDEIAAAGVGIIARPCDENDYDSFAEQLAAAAKARIPVAFSGNTPQQIRITAAMAVNAGMPADAALRGLTTAAADMTGMSAGTARLASGSTADFVIWSGSPLDLRAKPVCVVVQGEIEAGRPAGRITDE